MATLLLVEPDSLIRRTVVGVARTLALADIRESSTYEAAESLLQMRAFDGLIVALSDTGDGLQVIERLRAGTLKCPRDCPVIVMTARCDELRARTLLDLGVRRVILKPFKVRTVLESVDQLTR